MTLLVLVLCDDLDALGATSGSLDAQTLDPSGYAVTYVGRDLDDTARARLRHLVDRRPHLAAEHTDGSWTPAAEAALGRGASHVVVLEVGDVLHPEALERLARAAETGDDAVVARRVGQPLWGADGARGPVAAVLAAADAAERALPESGNVLPRVWIDAWHDALLEGGETTTLEDYAVLAPRPGATPSPRLALEESSVDWEGAELVVRAVVVPSLPGAGEPTVVLNGRSTLEHAVATETTRQDDRVTVTARIDVTTAALGSPLPHGPWDVWVQVLGAGGIERVRVARHDLSPALVHGVPVVPTLRVPDLQLQVGRVRRAWFRAVPDQATITETATGTALALPLDGPHVAGAEQFDGSLFVGGLRVPATITPEGGRLVLRAWLSGLAAEYPLAVSFGHVRPVSLGLTLEVDGVGAMRLTTRRSTPAAPAPAGEPAQGALGRVRAALPDPVVRQLGRVPGLRGWYAGRS